MAMKAYYSVFDRVRQPRLYSYPWWLDATCGKAGWEAMLFLDPHQELAAAMPYCKNRIQKLSAATTPPLTQWTSLINPDDLWKDIAFDPTEAFPKTQILDLSIRPHAHLQPVKKLPSPVTRYSYIIEAGESMDSIRSAYNENLRRNLRKAAGQFTVSESDDVDLLYRMTAASLHQQGQKAQPWLHDVLHSVCHELFSRGLGKILTASNGHGPVAAVLMGQDSHSAYYLAGGRLADPENMSAHALILDATIELAHAQGLAFDFEGSMHPGIANFFQSFGAQPEAFWRFRRFRGLGRVWALWH